MTLGRLSDEEILDLLLHFWDIVNFGQQRDCTFQREICGMSRYNFTTNLTLAPF